MPPVDWTLWHAITHKHRPHDRPYDPEPHAWQPVDSEAWGLPSSNVDRTLTGVGGKVRNHAPLTEGEPT